MNKENIYTTDGRVKHFSQEEDVNAKLARMLGERFVRYREEWDAVNKFELETEYPLFIQFDLNRLCNLRCVHCLQRYPEHLKRYSGGQNPLSWKGYQRVVLESEEFDCPSLTLCGINEPLIMPDMEEYIKYAHKHGFIDIMINTNGVLLTEERSKRILDCGLTRLRFSLDAASLDSYRKIRGRDDYDQVIKNIELFLKLKKDGGYKLPITGANFCKLSLNEHEEDKFLDFWRDKVDIVTTQTFTPLVSEKEGYSLYPSDQFDQKESLEQFKCAQPFQRVVVRDYVIYPCCYIGNDLKIGDLKTDTIYRAWNSKKMRNISDLHKTGQYKKNKTCNYCANLFFPQKRADNG
jgi:MoaA/NifB/PqqE/SkfB family radical SAM enzyme